MFYVIRLYENAVMYISPTKNTLVNTRKIRIINQVNLQMIIHTSTNKSKVYKLSLTNNNKSAFPVLCDESKQFILVL